MNDFTENVISVSEALKFMNDSMRIVKFRIEGEISSVNNSPKYKGVYFTIKDEKSKLDCIIWKDKYRTCGVDLEVGQKVELSGYFSVYAAKGTFSFTAIGIQLAGIGKIMAELEAMKKKLAKEGLFDEKNKKDIPHLPETIGLVTSGAGAAVHDVIRTIKRRVAGINIKFAGVNVEGKGSVDSVIEGLRLMDNANCDVILLVRGGGSFEDLLTFSDEEVVRAVARCKTPIVTGIGHEPDISISDLASDMSCSTPTAAAEMVTAGIYDLIASIPTYKNKLISLGDDIVVDLNKTLDDHKSAVEKCNPINLLIAYSKEIAHRKDYIKRTGVGIISKYSSIFEKRIAALNALSPTNTMKRGFSYVTDSSGSVVGSISKVHTNDVLKINFVDGRCISRVEEILD